VSGTRPTFWAALAVAGIGLPLLVLPSLTAVVAGLALVGVGTFFAQAAATGFIGRGEAREPSCGCAVACPKVYSAGSRIGCR